MKEPLIYISVSVEKELPNKRGLYHTFNSDTPTVEYYKDGEFITKGEADSWLKPFSLPELMEEALNDISMNYQTFDEGIWYDPLTEKQYTTKELVNDFLNQKGLI